MPTINIKKINFLFFFLCFLFFPSLLFAKSTFIEKFKTFYKEIYTFQGEFLQINHFNNPSQLPQKIKGYFWFKKPDYLKWIYLAPEKIEFYLYKGRFYVYYPEEKQVFVYPLKAYFKKGVIFQVFMMNDSFWDSLKVIQKERGLIKVKVQKALSYEGIKDLTLWLDQESGIIKKFSYLDLSGIKVTLIFKKLFLNKPIRNSLFIPHFPKDVDLFNETIPNFSSF